MTTDTGVDFCEVAIIADVNPVVIIWFSLTETSVTFTMSTVVGDGFCVISVENSELDEIYSYVDLL